MSAPRKHLPLGWRWQWLWHGVAMSDRIGVAYLAILVVFIIVMARKAGLL
jgi:hypothetical protein